VPTQIPTKKGYTANGGGGSLFSEAPTLQPTFKFGGFFYPSPPHPGYALRPTTTKSTTSKPT